MAERLPVGTTRDIRSPSFTSFGSNLSFNDVLINSSVDQPNGQTQTPAYKNTQLVLNGSSSIINKTALSEATAARNGGRSDDEWVEQDEPGVYITLTSLPGGIKDLKRVRFRYACFFFYKLIVLNAHLCNNVSFFLKVYIQNSKRCNI